MSDEKIVDESWKEAVAGERSGCAQGEGGCGCPKKEACGGQTDEGCGDGCGSQGAEGAETEIPVNFFTYMTSLGYQAMIFLGEIPNPMTGENDKNLRQAKFIIDTLIMIKDKTKGNLTQEEGSYLEGTLYELQMKFVELIQKGEKV